MGSHVVIGADFPGGWLKGLRTASVCVANGSVRAGQGTPCMAVRGCRRRGGGRGVAALGGAAGVEGWSLVAMVDSLAAEVPARPPPPGPPRPAADFLRLDEEREIAVLLRRLAALGPILTSDERVSRG